MFPAIRQTHTQAQADQSFLGFEGLQDKKKIQLDMKLFVFIVNCQNLQTFDEMLFVIQ